MFSFRLLLVRQALKGAAARMHIRQWQAGSCTASCIWKRTVFFLSNRPRLSSIMLGVRAAVVPCETIGQAVSNCTPLAGDEELCRANKHDCAALPTSSLREINARYRYTCGFMTENAVETFYARKLPRGLVWSTSSQALFRTRHKSFLTSDFNLALLGTKTAPALPSTFSNLPPAFASSQQPTEGPSTSTATNGHVRRAPLHSLV